jgi:hypothetical protein
MKKMTFTLFLSLAAIFLNSAYAEPYHSEHHHSAPQHSGTYHSSEHHHTDSDHSGHHHSEHHRSKPYHSEYRSRAYRSEDYDRSFIPLDLLIYRPLGLITTIVGTAVFIGVSPFTALASIPAPHDAFEKTANLFIMAPAHYTFSRPLGDTSIYKFPNP